VVFLSRGFGRAKLQKWRFRRVTFLARKWTCIKIIIMLYLVSVRCGCTGVCVVICGHVFTWTGLIYCNACNRIEQLVRTIQPPVSHYLEREVIWDRQVSQHRLQTIRPPVSHYLEREVIGTVRFLSSIWWAYLALSALPLDSSRQDAAGFATRTLRRVVPVILPDAPVLNTVSCLCLQLA